MDSMVVGDYLSNEYVKFNPDMLVVEAADKLIQNDLLGGPVCDGNNKLIGWISEQDCLGVVLQVIYHSQRIAIVKEIMRTDVLSISPDTTLVDAADLMKTGKPKNYPVVDKDGKLKGVINRRMILQAILSKITV